MSSKIACADCGQPHLPISAHDCGMLIAYYTDATTGKALIVDSTRADPRTLDLFLAACAWMASNHATAPAWASNIAHRYDAPLVRDLPLAAQQAQPGDFVVYEGAEYVWDGHFWRVGRERAMPSELAH